MTDDATPIRLIYAANKVNVPTKPQSLNSVYTGQSARQSLNLKRLVSA